MTCSGCGVIATEKIGDAVLTLYAETEDCLRDEVLENGWESNAGNNMVSHDIIEDYCPDCVRKKQKIDVN